MTSNHRAVLTFALAALPLVESPAALATTSSTTGLDQDRITQVAQRQRDFESGVQTQLLKIESERREDLRHNPGRNCDGAGIMEEFAALAGRLPTRG
jgi:hypothetical protein